MDLKQKFTLVAVMAVISGLIAAGVSNYSIEMVSLTILVQIGKT